MPTYRFKGGFFESQEMYELLKSFYAYGFVIIKNIPTKDNYIVKFANSIGSVRPTNFGEYFNVKSIPNPNDLAYTSLALSPHTDNPYRKPIPCIQLLHCIENKVSGGLSTLVDGFKVAKYLKKNNPEYFDVLTKVKVKFKFIDKDIILENNGTLIELDEIRNLKQVRFSTRLDCIPILQKHELELYYKARKEISSLYNSKKFRIEFKLLPGDLLMMDNYRLLHGRTSYNSNEGNRFLQGCYIDYDSSEGKLRHLKRKFDN
jgi:gamma-butyrobetaine dioxygenase